MSKILTETPHPLPQGRNGIGRPRSIVNLGMVSNQSVIFHTTPKNLQTTVKSVLIAQTPTNLAQMSRILFPTHLAQMSRISFPTHLAHMSRISLPTLLSHPIKSRILLRTTTTWDEILLLLVLLMRSMKTCLLTLRRNAPLSFR